jgi:uncharacterized protein
VRIRSLTYFANPGFPLNVQRVADAGDMLTRARHAIQNIGYEVQTLRMATPPFPRILAGKFQQAAEWAHALAESASSWGIDFVSVGPALPDDPESFAVLPDLLSASPMIFSSAIVAEPARGISMLSVRRAAEAIVSLAKIGGDGFSNLRFAALACVPPGSPFFPAAYHDDSGPAFALAPEAADLAVDAAAESSTIGEAGDALTNAIQRHAAALAQAAFALDGPAEFLGIDFSLAPFPDASRSLGTAFERLGVPRVGMSSSVLAAAVFTSAIDAASFPRTGFCGLLLPPFEDPVLAARAADGSLTVRDLLLYATVCGTGLDTIPLAGDTTADQIAPVLMDLAALAIRHGKPLTARLMPLPGKRVGDRAEFDFAFFAPTRVMPLPSAGVSGLLLNNAEDWVKIHKRN